MTAESRKKLISLGILKALLKHIASTNISLQAACLVAIANSAVGGIYRHLPVAKATDTAVQREIANLAGLHQLHLLLHSDSNHLLYCTLFCVSACAEQGTSFLFGVNNNDNRAEQEGATASRYIAQSHCTPASIGTRQIER